MALFQKQQQLSLKNQQNLNSNDEDSDDSKGNNYEIDSDMEIAMKNNNDQESELQKEIQEQFGQRVINNEERLTARFKEVRGNFYNRLESEKLIKKQGRIPFIENLTMTSEQPLIIHETLQVHDDIKREIAFYNIARENVQRGMKILVQSQVPISRPDDFFAEMVKTDIQMAKVKSRLLQQTQKMQNFEERKLKQENKKFHKAIKTYKMQEKHKEKKTNIDAISKFKNKVKDRADQGDDDEADFNKMFESKNNNGKRTGGPRKHVIDIVKDKHKAKNSFKKKSKGFSKGNKKSQRPGKNQRNKKGGGGNKRR